MDSNKVVETGLNFFKSSTGSVLVCPVINNNNVVGTTGFVIGPHFCLNVGMGHKKELDVDLPY